MDYDFWRPPKLEPIRIERGTDFSWLGKPARMRNAVAQGLAGYAMDFVMPRGNLDAEERARDFDQKLMNGPAEIAPGRELYGLLDVRNGHHTDGDIIDETHLLIDMAFCGVFGGHELPRGWRLRKGQREVALETELRQLREARF